MVYPRALGGPPRVPNDTRGPCHGVPPRNTKWDSGALGGPPGIPNGTRRPWGAPQDDPSKTGQLRHPADLNKPLREAAKEKANKYLNSAVLVRYLRNRSVSLLASPDA